PDPQESSAKPAAKLPPAPEPHAAAKKAEPAKPAAAKPTGTKTPPTQKAEKKPKEAADDPPLDLPRLRAQAVIEYLLQAGVRPDQVSAGPDAPAGPVAFALLP
ncbi:hypothetical protein ABS770_25715, partial [Methylobacterium brachiatum]